MTPPTDPASMRDRLLDSWEPRQQQLRACLQDPPNCVPVDLERFYAGAELERLLTVLAEKQATGERVRNTESLVEVVEDVQVGADPRIATVISCTTDGSVGYVVDANGNEQVTDATTASGRIAYTLHYGDDGALRVMTAEVVGEVVTGDAGDVCGPR